jgi:hypothetical protein
MRVSLVVLEYPNLCVRMVGGALILMVLVLVTFVAMIVLIRVNLW